MPGTRSQRPAPVTLTFELPLPPGVNNQYVTVGRRRVLSKEAKAFKRNVAKHVDQLRSRGVISPRAEVVLGESLLGAYLTFYFETPRRRDLDGGLKIALDALASAIGFDDRDIVDLHLTKQIDPLRPRLEVQLEQIADWQFDRTYIYLGEGPGSELDSTSAEEDWMPDANRGTIESTGPGAQSNASQRETT